MSHCEVKDNQSANYLHKILTKELGAPRAQFFFSWLDDRAAHHESQVGSEENSSDDDCKIPAAFPPTRAQGGGSQLESRIMKLSTPSRSSISLAETPSQSLVKDEAWVRLTMPCGKVYYWDRRSKSCSWSLSTGTEPAWGGKKCQDGRTYYWKRCANGTNGPALWALPPLENVTASTPSQALAALTPSRPNIRKPFADDEECPLIPALTPARALFPESKPINEDDELGPFAAVLRSFEAAKRREAECVVPSPSTIAPATDTASLSELQEEDSSTVKTLSAKLVEVTEDSAQLRAEVAALKQELAKLVGNSSQQKQEDAVSSWSRAIATKLMSDRKAVEESSSFQSRSRSRSRGRSASSSLARDTSPVSAGNLSLRPEDASTTANLKLALKKEVESLRAMLKVEPQNRVSSEAVASKSSRTSIEDSGFDWGSPVAFTPRKPRSSKRSADMRRTPASHKSRRIEADLIEPECESILERFMTSRSWHATREMGVNPRLSTKVLANNLEYGLNAGRLQARRTRL